MMSLLANHTTFYQPSSWKQLLEKYLLLPQGDKVQATYIWIDGTMEAMRAKTRTLDREPKSLDDIPIWSYCGYGTYQSKDLKNSELSLVPVAFYKDPFRLGKNKLVLCETFQTSKVGILKPTFSNTRNWCNKVLEQAATEFEPWFGIEQEYTLVDLDGEILGWPKHGFPAPMGPYYCGVGAGRVCGRDIVESHYRACLYCELDIYGENAEASLSQAMP